MRLAEDNLSAGAKKERQERERRQAAELAAKLVGEGGACISAVPHIGVCI